MRKILTYKVVQFFVGIGGIYSSYIYYGLLQEKLFRKDYSNGKQLKFTYSFAIVLFQSIFSCIVGKIVNYLVSKQIKSKINVKEQIKMGFYNATSMLCSNTALVFVSYPIQALIKSCKILSVLLVGLFIGKRKFTKSQYMFVCLITVGIIIFNLTESSVKAQKNKTSLFGVLLCFLSLFSDGMLATQQDTVNSTQKPGSFDMMGSVNLWCATFCLTYATTTLQLFDFVDYCMQYPLVIPDLIKISFMGTIGQIFIFYTITHFSSLLLSISTTTRKFFTVLVSIVYYQHSINIYQWISILFIFAGVSIDFYEGVRKNRKHKKHHHKHT